MTLPLFDVDDDPGPSFVGLLRSMHLEPAPPPQSVAGEFAPPHGTTVLALRYADGAVVAGDRRATSGNLISHRTIEKVFPADSHSVVAIAGAAGPAVEMVRLFQLQLEHYEKVEGSSLSLEGKANQLGQMLRSNLPAAMQGLAVVPIFAGYDATRDAGRLFRYDITGGRYEETDHVSSGSGSLHAGTVLKLRWRPELDREAAIDAAVEALYQAADDDSATGGPDAVRRIYPIVATVTADGYQRLGDDELAGRFGALLERLTEEAPR